MPPNPGLEAILSANVDELQEDKEQADELCQQLFEVDPESLAEVPKLQKVVIVCQALIERKAVEVELVQEETEELKSRHRDEINFYQTKLDEAQRLAKLGGAAAAGSDAVEPVDNLRREILSLGQQLELTEIELANTKIQLDKERHSSEEFRTKIDRLETEVKGVEELKRQHQTTINSYMERLKALGEAGQSRQHDDVDQRKAMQQRYQEIVQLRDENINLSERNVQIESQMRMMEEKMDNATSDFNRITEDYVNVKKVLHQSDVDLENLRKQCEKYKLQVTDLNEQVRSKMDTEDEIMVAVNRKVEEWKQAIEQKNDQVSSLEREVMNLRQQLIAMSMDGERVKMAALEKGVQERDTEIKTLQHKLNTAVEDIEQSNALIEDLRSQFTKEFSGGGTADLQLKKIRELQASGRDTVKQMRGLEERVVQAEADAREKDRELNEIQEKMRQYEMGQYGLSDAIAEIKQCKQLVNKRDGEIVKLTQDANGLYRQLQELQDENGELRDRLGLDPSEKVDTTNSHFKKYVKQEVDRDLMEEIKQLTEEKLELKRQIYKLALQGGQRAVALGLTPDDMQKIDEFTDGLKNKHNPYDVKKVKKEAETDELKVRAQLLEQESEKYLKDMERIRQTNAELNLKIKRVDEENKNLEAGLTEVLKSVKEANQNKADSSHPVHVESPTLERMLAAIEAKQITGNYDAALHLKAQVDNLTGRNEELRRELRETRVEGNRSRNELQKAEARLGKLEDDLKIVRDAGGRGMLFQTLTLPEGMAVSSADVIASLNEHLVQTLHELSQKEDSLSKTEEGLEQYKRKFGVARHQLGLLYQQFNEERNEWQKQSDESKEKINQLESSITEDKVKVQEFNRLVDSLGSDDVEVRRRLADMSRKITVLRVNEKALTRRYNMMVEIEAQLRKENNKLKNEQLAMETAVTERLGYLQRYKEMASFKIATLQKTREESVPLSELEAANKQYEELTEKYRDLLENSNKMISTNEHSATLEMEVKRLEFEKSSLSKELEIEKEKTHVYQASLETLKRQGLMAAGQTISADEMSMAKKLATLEMKEINERQRAEHAVRMYEQRREMLATLEARNSDLEQKFQEVTKMNLEAQRVERQLRDELSNCVLKSVSDADRAKISQLEQSENSLKIENSRLKEVADVAINQASTLELQKVSQEKELTSLRQQLVDIQSQSDEKKVIGKLHRHIVQLQVSEGTAVKRLEDSGKKLTKVQAQLLRMEQRLDEKDQALLHHKAESANKSRHLRRTIHELRRMFSGSVPLSKQERFAQAMVHLQEDKVSFAKQLKQVQEDREAIEDKLAALSVQHASLQELITTLRDGKGAEKVTEWHTKMESLRLDDLKKSRQINRLTEQVSFMQLNVRQHETTISTFEDENVRLTRHYEERQLQWEAREMEMERIIAKLEGQQRAIAGAASKFEEATGRLPDITLPVSEQLEQAINTIKDNVRVIIETQADSKAIKKESADLKLKLKELDANLLSRDRIIAELRLRLPATSERDDLIRKATAGAQYQEEQYETKQALRVAQSTIGSLQARIDQKDNTISKLQALLRSARDEMAELCNKHETDMKLMIDRLHVKTDDHFSKIRAGSVQHLKSAPAGTVTSQQLARLNELEDTVIQQDNQIAALSQRLRETQAEVEKWRNKEERTSAALGSEKQQILREHTEQINRLTTDNENLRGKISDLRQQVGELEGEVQVQREANERAPTVATRNLVEKLRNQLETKEHELKKMGVALQDIRADMVAQAEEQVRLNSKDSAADWNVQKLLDKKTKDLQDKIEELESQLDRTRGDGRRRRDRETNLQLEVEELRDEMARRETNLNRLKESKRRLEEENEALERRVDRLNNAKKQAGGSKELEQLRNQVKSLEAQLSEAKLRLNMAEKPIEDTIRPQTAPKLTSAIEKWEETKKLQKQMEKLRAKISSLEGDNSKLKSTNESMRALLERTQKTKEALEKKVYKNSPPIAPPLSYGKTAGLSEAQLQEQNKQLLEEVGELRQQVETSRDTAYEQVNARNRELTEKLGQLERYISEKFSGGEPVKPAGSALPQDYGDLVTREQQLQSNLLKATEENISLRFEITQLQTDLPKLKEKIESQKQYIEALKAERGDGTNRSFGSWVSGTSTPGSGIRRIGESGRTTKELEKTVALMKKVIDKTRRENEALKMAPGIVSNERLTNLERENEGLKEQLGELRSKMGATLTERYEMKDQGTRKLTHDFERLRKDLRKEQEQSEKQRVALNGARLQLEQQNKQLEELRAKLSIEQSKPSMAQLDHKGWKAAVTTRMSEEKLARTGAELEQKNKTLADMKILLKDAALRETELGNKNEELKRQVSILERFPQGSNLSDSELMAHYQQSKLTNQRLEDEKAELLQEIRKLKGHSIADQFDETVVERARNYDRLLRDQADQVPKVRDLELQLRKTQEENIKMKKELSNFGPEFFEEIEDLKYNYKESEIRNAQLEEKLKDLCEQFGVPMS